MLRVGLLWVNINFKFLNPRNAIKIPISKEKNPPKHVLLTFPYLLKFRLILNPNMSIPLRIFERDGIIFLLLYIKIYLN